MAHINITDLRINVKYFFLIIMFLFLAKRSNAQLGTAITQEQLDSLPYVVLDTMPQYPGGQSAMMQYIHDALNYHPEGYAITGNVFIEFIVEKNGNISGVNILKKLAEYHDKEALRVIQSMNNWSPGIKNGKPVRTKMILPVRFTIQ